jgi:hypothetical protein
MALSKVLSFDMLALALTAVLFSLKGEPLAQQAWPYIMPAAAVLSLIRCDDVKRK